MSMPQSVVQEQSTVSPSSTTPFAEELHESASKPMKTVIIIAVVAILLGIGTGFVGATVLSHGASSATVATTGQTAADTSGTQTPTVKVGEVFGSKDTSAFKDSVEGVMLPGGIGSEGSHHIVREGGASQNVYLTSSVVDLKMFENAKVKVYGETFKAQKAGWLMDVGRVEVEQLNAPLPAWAAAQQTQTQQQQGD